MQIFCSKITFISPSLNFKSFSTTFLLFSLRIYVQENTFSILVCLVQECCAL